MELIRLILIALFSCLIAFQISSTPSSSPPLQSPQLSSELQKLKYKFSTALSLHSSAPGSIEITILDPCNLTVSRLRKTCQLSDPQSCKSCPYTSCHHFPAPASFGRVEIPANSAPDLGYCVALKDLSAGCNPYHGSWTLIKASSYLEGNLNPNTYIRFCLCSRPGYIGNVSLFGNCSHAFICDGDVEDINVPYEKINCRCLNEFRPITVGANGRGCVPPTVQQRENWATVPKPLNFAPFYISVQDFLSQEVRKEVSALDEIMDPCSRCPVTGRPTYGGAVVVENGLKEPTMICRPCEAADTPAGNFGIPLKRFLSKEKTLRLLKGSWGPDIMLAVEWKHIWVYGSSNDDGRKQDCVYVFGDSEYNREFYQKLGLQPGQEYALNVGNEALLGLTILPKASFTPRLYPNCYRGNRSPADGAVMYTCDLLSANLAQKVSNWEIVDRLINNTKNNIISSFLTKKYQEPGSYAQSLKHWYSVQKLRCAFGVAQVEMGEETLQYLTYNRAFVEDSSVKKLVNFVGMRVRALTNEERRSSNWNPHRSGLRHYLVEFMFTKEKIYCPPDNHVLDPSFDY